MKEPVLSLFLLFLEVSAQGVYYDQQKLKHHITHRSEAEARSISGYHDHQRAIPPGVARPQGRPNNGISSSKTALRIGDWTAQWSQSDSAWYVFTLFCFFFKIQIVIQVLLQP